MGIVQKLRSTATVDFIPSKKRQFQETVVIVSWLQSKDKPCEMFSAACSFQRRGLQSRLMPYARNSLTINA